MWKNEKMEHEVKQQKGGFLRIILGGIHLGGIRTFLPPSPGIFLDLGVLEHFRLKNQTRKIGKVHEDFELHQVFLWQTVLIFAIYISYSQKELKHFSLEILVIHGILEDIVLNVFEYIFWYICTKIRKEKYYWLFTKTFERGQSNHTDVKW